TAPGSEPFVPYLVNDVIRVVSGQAQRLQSQELAEATHASPPPWQVCAPAGNTGGKVDAPYAIVSRPGVTARITHDGGTSCATASSLSAERPAEHGCSRRQACPQPPRHTDEGGVGPRAADELDPDREPRVAGEPGHAHGGRAEQRPQPGEARVAGGCEAFGRL